MGNIYHVAKSGSDQNRGSADAPFATIQRAADLAVAGDTVIVHAGEYREWVKPRNGGLYDKCRIIYEAAEGEKVVIKGSERITGWELVKGNVWKVVLPNEFFEEYNPYQVLVMGDWLVAPREKPVHTGEIYLNGKSFYETFSLEQVLNPEIRIKNPYDSWRRIEEEIPEPEQTKYQWYCETDEENTYLYANFQGADPNVELVEINVRRSCFYPERTGLNYITVRGFEMAQAAAPWVPPTADQPGMLGPNWSKGWIIENNIIHDAKCSGISLGKEASTGDNDAEKYRRKPGYQHQMEAVFRAKNMGWGRERIGSHIVRNNVIYDCGQNGIVGHMGCIFSEIYNNEIYNIAVKHEFYGHEIAGIKLHAAIDVQIHDNYIHHCSLGTWLDWQAQGTRVSGNIYDANNRDIMIEVTHGPFIVDNNIFTSAYTFDNAAQGGAYLHNLCCGLMHRYPVMNRATPYHLPHSTDLLGTALVYSGDDRWYQNIFLGGEAGEEVGTYGTTTYDGSAVSMEEYVERVRAEGNKDTERFERVKQPACIDGNVYLKGAQAFDREENHYTADADPGVRVVTEGDEVFLELTLPEDMDKLITRIYASDELGLTRISEACFEAPDGSTIVFDKDLKGNARNEHPVPGPLEELKSGNNRIKIWDRRVPGGTLHQ